MCTTKEERFKLQNLLGGKAYGGIREAVLSDLFNNFKKTTEEFARKESRNEPGGYFPNGIPEEEYVEEEIEVEWRRRDYSPRRRGRWRRW